MPTVNPPTCIACKAYSIWTNLPDGEKVVKEKSYFDIRNDSVTMQFLKLCFYSSETLFQKIVLICFNDNEECIAKQIKDH